MPFYLNWIRTYCIEILKDLATEIHFDHEARRMDVHWWHVPFEKFASFFNDLAIAIRLK